MSYQPKPGTRIRAMYDLLVSRFREGHLSVRWSDLHRAYCRSIESKKVGRFALANSYKAMCKIAVRNGDGTWSIKHELIQDAQKEAQVTDKKVGQLTVEEETDLVQQEATITNELLGLEDEYKKLVTRSKEIQARKESLSDELRMIYRNRIAPMPWYQFAILREQVEAHYQDSINYAARQPEEEDPLSR